MEVGRRIAFFLPSLSGGGLEKNFLHLAEAFADDGHTVDMVLTRLEGEYRAVVPASVNLIELVPVGTWQSRLWALKVAGRAAPALARPVLGPLRSPRILRYLPDLARYLTRCQPAALIAGSSYPNLVALMARRVTGVSTRIIVTEHNTLSQAISRRRRKWRWRYLPPVMRRLYPWADAVVAVSEGVADDLAETTGLPREKIVTIYNPVVSSALNERAQAVPEHPWFAPGSPPVILGVGRFAQAKRLDVLIRAFAHVRLRREVHLLILGEGRDRHALEALVTQLGLTHAIDMPGFVGNPYGYMAHARLFVLSSAYEGLPTVLIEALACGCPVVSTDCPSGPREILQDGEYGRLVPVGDVHVLAEAMSEALDREYDPDRLRDRAAAFSLDLSVKSYRALCFPEQNP